jgi:LacI family transcriptional regulator
MADVAREAGVSKQTVSRVVNGKGETSPETAARVLQVIDDLGYRPSGVARSLATQRTLSLGLIVQNLSNPYYSEIAQGAEIAAWEHGYSMFLYNVFENASHEQAVLHALEDRGVDGIVLDSPKLPSRLLLPLLARHRATVLIGYDVPTDAAGLIWVDDEHGIALALDHLRGRGRRVTALLAGRLHYRSARVRRDAFVEGVLRRDGAVDEALIIEHEPDADSSRRSASELLARRPDIDSVICFNDIVAAGALQACRELGRRVPDDVAVIGHDDIPLASLTHPTLTTLRISKRDLGANAVRMLVDRLEGRNHHTEVVHRPELVLRESSP